MKKDIDSIIASTVIILFLIGLIIYFIFPTENLSSEYRTVYIKKCPTITEPCKEKDAILLSISLLISKDNQSVVVMINPAEIYRLNKCNIYDSDHWICSDEYGFQYQMNEGNYISPLDGHFDPYAKTISKIEFYLLSFKKFKLA